MTTYLNGAARDVVRLADRRTYPDEHLRTSAATTSRDVADDLDERAQSDADVVAAILAVRHETTRLADTTVGIPDAVDAVSSHLDELAGAVPAVQHAAEDLPQALTVLIAHAAQAGRRIATAILAAGVILAVAVVVAVVLR